MSGRLSVGNPNYRESALTETEQNLIDGARQSRLEGVNSADQIPTIQSNGAKNLQPSTNNHATHVRKKHKTKRNSRLGFLCTTCVSPRQKREEPCKSGKMAVSQDMGRISFAVRPSQLFSNYTERISHDTVRKRT